MSARANRSRIWVALAVLAACSPAYSNPLDIFGLGARGPALANAMGPLADDAAAAFYNPAGLALGTRPSVLLAYGAGWTHLRFDGRDAGGETARGMTLGVAFPREVAGTTIAFGAALYFPDQRVVRVRALPSTEPRFASYDDRMHRIAIHPALAWRPWSWLSFGAGVSILADAKGAGADLDVRLDLNRAQDPAAQRAQASLDVQLPTRIAPVVGLWARPHPRVRASLVYRASLSLDVALDTRLRIDAGLLRGSALTGLSQSDYFTPAALTLGVAAEAIDGLTLSLEAAWFRWSSAPSLLPQIRAALDLGLPLDVVSVPFPDAALRLGDVVVLRLGVEGRIRAGAGLDVTLRAGGAHEPTPYPRQTGPASLADSDKWLLSLGAGIEWRDLGAIVRGPLRVDAYFQAHVLVDRLHPKLDPFGPTPTFRSGGRLFAAGLAVGLGF
jgi:long-subunit fatty acid transport protein